MSRAAKPWNNLEKYALTRYSKNRLPVLAKNLDRPLEEVQAKYNELLGILGKTWNTEFQILLKQGLSKDEARGLLLTEENYKKILFRSAAKLPP